MNLFHAVTEVWFLWYIILPLFAIILLFLIESANSTGVATFVTVLTLLALELFTSIQPFSYAISNPLETLWFGLAYVAAGVVYVWIKWYFFVHARLRTEIEHRKKWPNDVSPLKAPRVDSNKSRIIGWMLYWPISAAWTILNDPLYRLFESIYNFIGSGLQKIANKIYASAETDLSNK